MALPKQPARARKRSDAPSLLQRAALHPALLAVLLALMTFIAYLRVVRSDFVNYDDGDYVTANSHVLSGLTRENLAWAMTTVHASNWHPLTWMSLMLDAQLFGKSSTAMHLVSLALHVANSVLLFHLWRRMTQATWRSFAVAALFALHPIHVESVAWVSERKDVLSAFFFLLSLEAYVSYAVPKALPSTRAVIAYLLSLVLFALGLMSKPMLVTLPFVLMLLDFWPLQRIDFSLKEPGRKFRILLLEKLPFLLMGVASCVITLKAQARGGAISADLTLGARIANAGVSYARYLAKTFWPHKLSVLYPHPGEWPVWKIVGAAALLILITVFVVALGRRRAYLPVGWLWFCGMLVPAIGFIQVGIQSMADRYTYLPLIGLFASIVWLLGELASQENLASTTDPPKRLAGLPKLIAGVVLPACALLTFVQTGYWHDSGALFRHAVEVTDRNYLACNNLGFYLSGLGKTEEAKVYYLKSLGINPKYEDALNNYGHALATEKNFSEAIPYYQAALAVRPRHPEVHNNLGVALSELGRVDEAMEHYRIALEQVPDHANAHNNLGIALAMKGNLDEAIPHFQAAIRFKPDYASAHGNLGNAYAAQGKFDEAIGEYQTALRISPDDSQSHNNLANVLTEKGRLDEAILHYGKALELNPRNPEAHCNLALALQRQGKTSDAVSHYREALRLKPNYPQAEQQLRLLTQP